VISGRIEKERKKQLPNPEAGGKERNGKVFCVPRLGGAAGNAFKKKGYFIRRGGGKKKGKKTTKIFAYKSRLKKKALGAGRGGGENSPANPLDAKRRKGGGTTKSQIPEKKELQERKGKKASWPHRKKIRKRGEPARKGVEGQRPTDPGQERGGVLRRGEGGTEMVLEGGAPGSLDPKGCLVVRKGKSKGPRPPRARKKENPGGGSNPSEAGTEKTTDRWAGEMAASKKGERRKAPYPCRGGGGGGKKKSSGAGECRKGGKNFFLPKST